MVVAKRHGDRKLCDFRSFLFGIMCGAALFAVHSGGGDAGMSRTLLLYLNTESEPPSAENGTPKSVRSIEVSDECRALAQIRPAGSVFFASASIQEVATLAAVQPPFRFGTTFPNPKNVAYHMQGDIPYYEMIRNHIQSLKEAHPGMSLEAIDAGANQGFYTYFLASLGTIDAVHSFEIEKNNFKALQHGILFNTPAVANRVKLYPMGLGASEGRWSMEGKQYTGFLKQGDDGRGAILTASLDCVAHHTQLFTASHHQHRIGFVKIDVEGFEIAVLRGAEQTLYNQNNNPQAKIGSLFVEVGPDRWSRAGVSLDDGIQAMARLSLNFEEAYIVLRDDKQCPQSLQDSLQAGKTTHHNTDGVIVMSASTRRVLLGPDDWKPLLEAMNSNRMDCNFWFTNSKL